MRAEPAGVALGDLADVALLPGEMKYYQAGERVPESELVPVGRAEDHGGETIAGDLRLSARTDYRNAANGVWAGVLQATGGAARYRLPYHRHETVLHGSLRITDESGSAHDLEVGDTYLATQGTTIEWQPTSDVLQTTFMTILGTDSPAPVLVYRVNEEVPQDQVAFLGRAEELGATVVSGEPNLHGRPDFSDGEAAGGIFQADRCKCIVHFPFTIEHATFIKNSVTMTDELQNRHTFGPGDTYLIGKPSDIVWDQTDDVTQKAFFNNGMS